MRTLLLIWIMNVLYTSYVFVPIYLKKSLKRNTPSVFHLQQYHDKQMVQPHVKHMLLSLTQV